MFKPRYTAEKKIELETILFSNIKTNVESLKEMYKLALERKQECYYRFYHQSFKVYGLQENTLEIKNKLNSIAPKDAFFNEWFSTIIDRGTNITFKTSHNTDWLERTLPILQAFDHALYFLELAIKCSKYEELGQIISTDIAGLLYLFNLR
jgi:hypothetical protein